MFITVEGGEGVGKSTFCHHLATKIKHTAGFKNVVTTREPGGTVIGEKIRSLCSFSCDNESLTMASELLLIGAARSQHVKYQLRPALERGDTVICDRYTDSTRVYQGILGGVSLQSINCIIDLATTGLEPDITFLLDCDPAIAMKRLKLRAQLSGSKLVHKYDQQDINFHYRLREAYLQVARLFTERIVVLNAINSRDMLIAAAANSLASRHKA